MSAERVPAGDRRSTKILRQMSMAVWWLSRELEITGGKPEMAQQRRRDVCGNNDADRQAAKGQTASLSRQKGRLRKAAWERVGLETRGVTDGPSAGWWVLWEGSLKEAQGAVRDEGILTEHLNRFCLAPTPLGS